MSFATINLHGNLGQPPETKYTPNGAMVVEFSIAVNDYRDKDAPPVWYRVSCWDRLGERVDKLAQNGNLDKGSSLYVEGDYRPREYQTSDGRQGVSHDVTMTNFQFTGSRQDQDGQQGQSQQRPRTETSRQATRPQSNAPTASVDDVPF